MGISSFSGSKGRWAPAWEGMLTKIFNHHQCAKFLPVVVRQLGEDESDETEGQEATGQTGTTTTPETAAPGSEAAKLTEALGKLATAIKQAVTDNPALREGIQSLVAGFQTHLKSNELAEAKEALYEIAGLLKREAERKAATTAPTGGPAKVEFEKLHLDWDKKKQEAGAKIEALHSAILAEYNDPEAATAAKALERIIGRFNEGLGDTLDLMRNATTPAARAELAAKASGIAKRYLQFLESDPLVAHAEANPYEVDVAVRETLSPALTAIDQQLQKVKA